MVSVIVATYRRDEPLKRALTSLLDIVNCEFEVVVVDDNADENWNEKVISIVNSFLNKLDIKYIRNEKNEGSANTRNIGIREARGEYITFLDDDDLYMPEKIAKQLELMKRTKADYSLTNLALYNEDETVSEIRKRPYLLTEESNNLLLCHLKYHMTGTDTMMFKKEYILSFGGFASIDVGDEFYLMLRAIEKGGVFAYCDSCDVKAYVHTAEDGLSSGESKIKGENNLYAFKKRYFSNISLKNRRYIRMRHYAVLAFAFKRCGKKWKFISSGIKALLVDPVQSLKLLHSRKSI